jgi:hypothetical protein
MRRSVVRFALAVCAVSACGEEVYYVQAGARGGSDGAPAADADASASVGADASAAGADAPTVQPDAPAGGIDVAPGCVADEDCPPADGVCAMSRCEAGRCVTVNAPSGTRIVDVPADCHATICDGAGHAAGVLVARANAPTPPGPCLVGTCDELGRPGTTPRPAGTACRAAPGTEMCDGAGSCVECNHTRDCAPGLYCDASHRCGSAPCTDLDCGGACPPCDVGKRCRVDADCQSYACDASTATCVLSQCLDHVQDGNETDLDCGGGICQGCELGQGCLLDLDCLSQACDVPTSKCILEQCADHRADGIESDVDCGGGCSACQSGQKCKGNGDCAPGHVCLTATKTCS